MATTDTPAAPAAPAPAPIAPPAAPAAPVAAAQPKPVTPPIPKAQADSAPKPNQTPKPEAKRPTESMEDKLNKLAEENFGTEGEAPKAPEPPKAPDKTPEPKPGEAPPAAPAKDVFDGMELPANASEAQKTNFKKMREAAAAEVNTLKNERAALVKELETYKKASPGDSADKARLEAELKEVRDKLAVYDVSSHPDFQRQYTDPKKKALATASSLLADNAVEGAPNIAALLDKPRNEFSKALTEAAGKLPLFDQQEFMANAREAYRLHGEEKTALSKAGELRQALQAKAAQEARTAFESSRGEFQTRVPALEIPEGTSEEDAASIREYNTAREEAFAKAERFTFGKATDREVADVATRAAALDLLAHHVLPMTQKREQRANALVKELTAELTAIKGKKAAPEFAGSTPSDAPKQFKSFDELAKNVFGE